METLFRYLIVIFVIVVTVTIILGAETIRKSRKKSIRSNNGAAANGGNKHYSFARNWGWIILVVIALTGFGLWFTDLGLWLIGFGLAWSPFSQSPSLQTASAFVQTYWLTIFSLYVILALALFISLNANTELRGWSETTQRILIGVMLLLFVGLPILSWMTSPSAPRTARLASTALEIPIASEDRNLWPESSWLQIVVPEGGKSKMIPVRPGMHVEMFGTEFRYHCVYRDGREISFVKGEKPCPSGDLPLVYATNNAKGSNIILVAYAVGDPS